MRRTSGLVVALMYVVIFSGGCASEKVRGRSMDQVYMEKGIPVHVVQIKSESFVKDYSYFGLLKGIRESNAGAPIGGRIDRVHFQVGDSVKKDVPVVSFPTDSPATQYYQARVNFRLAQTTLQRIENLYRSGGISRQEFDNTRTRYEVARANWDAVRQSVHVRAPISGVITQINVRPTDTVEKKTLLFTVARTDRLKTRVWVAEQDISHIRRGDCATAEWQNRKLGGRVVQIDRSQNPLHQAFGVEVELDNPGLLVPSGVNARIILSRPESKGSVVIARSWIVFENKQAFVFVACNGKAEKRSVEIGRKQGDRVEILHGIRPGEAVVSDGQMLVEDGALLNVLNASAAVVEAR